MGWRVAAIGLDLLGTENGGTINGPRNDWHKSAARPSHDQVQGNRTGALAHGFYRAAFGRRSQESAAGFPDRNDPERNDRSALPRSRPVSGVRRGRRRSGTQQRRCASDRGSLRRSPHRLWADQCRSAGIFLFHAARKIGFGCDLSAPARISRQVEAKQEAPPPRARHIKHRAGTVEPYARSVRAPDREPGNEYGRSRRVLVAYGTGNESGRTRSARYRRPILPGNEWL